MALDTLQPDSFRRAGMFLMLSVRVCLGILGEPLRAQVATTENPASVLTESPQLLQAWAVTDASIPRSVVCWSDGGSGAAARLSADPAVEFPRGTGAYVFVAVRGPWQDPRDSQLYFSVEPELARTGAYVVTFWVRTSEPTSFPASVIVNQPPWSLLSESCVTDVVAGPSWQQVSVSFSPDTDIARGMSIRSPCLLLGLLPAGSTVWVAGVTLTETRAPVPPLEVITSGELLQNPGFEDGLSGWHDQAAQIVAVGDPVHRGHGACLVRERTARWGSPSQDIRAALVANGSGFYIFSALVRPLSGQGEALAVVHTKDAAGDHWTPSRARRTSVPSFSRLTASSFIGWSGELEAADISVQTTGEDTGDIIVDDLSLRAATNLARTGAFSAAAETPGHTASMAFDGDVSSYWQGISGPPSWLEVDLGRRLTFNAFVLSASHSGTQSYALQVWDTAWHTVFAGKGIRTPVDRINVEPVSGSKVRLLFTDGTSTPGIGEFAFYACSGPIAETTERIPPPPADASQRGERTLVGAIRWDGWCGDKSQVGLELERVMGPELYHFRLPFYALIKDAGQVEARCVTQETMDQEIACAKEAGIDYWAFDWYPPEDGLATARTLYLSSSHRQDVRWCVILCTGAFTSRDLTWQVEQFQTPNYQCVLGGRPLVYLFSADRKYAHLVTSLREECVRRGVPTPFVVCMGWSAAATADVADACGADALGAYVNPVGDRNPYAKNMEHEQRQWEALRATGKQVVPTVTTGWDTRPFFDHRVDWYPGATEGNWVETATAGEVAKQLEQSLEFVKDNPEATLANTVLIYAWNENAEGGWIVPTLFEMRDAGYPVRLDAIRSVLRSETTPGAGWDRVCR